MLHNLAKDKPKLLKKLSTLTALNYNQIREKIEYLYLPISKSFLLLETIKVEKTTENWALLSFEMTKYLLTKSLNNKFNKGKEIEFESGKYLSKLGHKIIIFNYRNNGEIDIITEFEKSIRFIEVKSSFTNIFLPEEKITSRKINVILNVSESFLRECLIEFERIGYDAIVWRKNKVEYIKDFLT